MERPIIKNPKVLAFVELIESELKKFTDSPYSESYLTIYNQLSSFNNQLQIGEEETIIDSEGISVQIRKGFVDLFAESTDKSFDRTKWYFENILDLNKTLDELKKLMTPEQRKEIEEKIKMDGLGIAEKLAISAKNK